MDTNDLAAKADREFFERLTPYSRMYLLTVLDCVEEDDLSGAKVELEKLKAELRSPSHDKALVWVGYTDSSFLKELQDD